MMSFNVKVRQIGNSCGIIFPNLLLKKLNLHIGDSLIGKDSDSSIILNVAKPIKKYRLKDLVAQSKRINLTQEDEVWLNLEDVGKEVVW